MDEKQLIETMYLTGHFWDPAATNALNVQQADLPKLTLSDKAVIEAAASFQRADANLVPLVRMFHSRAPIFDGGVGPATMALAQVPRCPIPDFAPPSSATFHYDDPQLQRAVERMQAATGSGSWPAGCYADKGVHEVKISYDLSKLSDKHREWWSEIKEKVRSTFAAVGVRLIEVPVGEKANITLYGRSLGGSIIGMAEFNSETCGDVVFCQLTPSFAPSLLSVEKLVDHEVGHNMNLNHRNGGIMNPSIMPDSLPNYWIKREGGKIVYQDNSYPTLKGFFGGEEINAPPLPPPSPPTGKLTLTVEIDDEIPSARVLKIVRGVGNDWDT